MGADGAQFMGHLDEDENSCSKKRASVIDAEGAPQGVKIAPRRSESISPGAYKPVSCTLGELKFVPVASIKLAR
jgi:hypothetical protein